MTGKERVGEKGGQKLKIFFETLPKSELIDNLSKSPGNTEIVSKYKRFEKLKTCTQKAK